jgi:pyruvate dehydrogenase E1 component
MSVPQPPNLDQDSDPLETQDWIQSLEAVLRGPGPARAEFLLKKLQDYAGSKGIAAPLQLNTPYLNTIPTEAQPPYPGDQAIEWRIRCMVRWNAMAMVLGNRRTYLHLRFIGNLV